MSILEFLINSDKQRFGKCSLLNSVFVNAGIVGWIGVFCLSVYFWWNKKKRSCVNFLSVLCASTYQGAISAGAICHCLKTKNLYLIYFFVLLHWPILQLFILHYWAASEVSKIRKLTVFTSLYSNVIFIYFLLL